jgi:hypothetical protein
MHHDIFWKTIEVMNNNQQVLEKGGDLFNWIKNSYIEAASVAFRRQLDRDNRAVSLMNVLITLERECDKFTKEDFQRLVRFIPGHMMHRPEKWNAAGETFDDVFGNGKAHLDPDIVRADIELLGTESAAIKEQVDKEIAHSDRNKMQRPRVTGEMFEACLNQLDEITRKYIQLVDGQVLDPLKPIFMYDFEEVFTFTWKK